MKPTFKRLRICVINIAYILYIMWRMWIFDEILLNTEDLDCSALVHHEAPNAYMLFEQEPTMMDGI